MAYKFANWRLPIHRLMVAQLLQRSRKQRAASKWLLDQPTSNCWSLLFSAPSPSPLCPSLIPCFSLTVHSTKFLLPSASSAITNSLVIADGHWDCWIFSVDGRSWAVEFGSPMAAAASCEATSGFRSRRMPLSGPMSKCLISDH
jgi:hypothetical protein